MSRQRLSARFAAMAVALVGAHAAYSGVVRKAFQVNAVVIPSARVSATVRKSGGAIEVRASGHRSARAALLVDGQVKAIGEGAAIVAIPPRGDVAVTVLY